MPPDKDEQDNKHSVEDDKQTGKNKDDIDPSEYANPYDS